MTEYIIRVNKNDERWYYVEQQYTHFFGYPIMEEIVRCRDCKYHAYMPVSYLDNPLSVCISEQWIGAEGDNPLVKPYGFCAWGERKERIKP